jgi:hypothetical protein
LQSFNDCTSLQVNQQHTSFASDKALCNTLSTFCLSLVQRINAIEWKSAEAVACRGELYNASVATIVFANAIHPQYNSVAELIATVDRQRSASDLIASEAHRAAIGKSFSILRPSGMLSMIDAVDRLQ